MGKASTFRTGERTEYFHMLPLKCHLSIHCVRDKMSIIAHSYGRFFCFFLGGWTLADTSGLRGFLPGIWTLKFSRLDHGSRRLCRLTAVSQNQGTAGNNPGRGPAANPVPCESGSIQYNLNDGIFNFTVQASDVTGNAAISAPTIIATVGFSTSPQSLISTIKKYLIPAVAAAAAAAALTLLCILWRCASCLSCLCCCC